MPLSVALNIEVEYVPDFREINNGILAGMPNAIAKEKFPDLFYSTLEWNESYPQGESPRVFYERIKTTWEQFSKAIARSGKNAVLVTHGGVISVIYSLIDGMPYSNKVKTQQVAFATLLPIKYNNGIWQKV